MELSTATLAATLPLTAATLNESTKETGTLELEFAGFLPPWATYMEPVCLRHKGRVVFHGKITSCQQSNTGGEVTSCVTVSNVLWVLDHSTLAQQLAEIRESIQDSAGGGSGSTGKLIVSAGQRYSFKSLAGGINVATKAWTPSSASTGGGCTITASLSNRIAGRVCATTQRVRGGVITTETALRRAQELNPDCLRLVDYEEGCVRLLAVEDAEIYTIDTQTTRLVDASGIEPQYESCVVGVALVMTGENGGITGTIMHPAGLDAASVGVKVFQVNAAGATNSDVAIWRSVAAQYYDGANVLQHGGSIVLLAEDVEESPLGKRVNIVGEGAAPEWATMQAIVNGVTWDLMEGTLELSLGHDVSDPEFHEPQVLEGGEDDSDDPGSDPGGEDVEDESDASEDESFDDTWETQSVSGSLMDSYSGSEPGSEPGSTPGSEPGSTPGSEPGSTPGSSCADCTQKWEELDEWKTGIESRLEALEQGQPGSSLGSNAGSGCDCSAKLEEIQKTLEALKTRIAELENGDCACVAQVQACIDTALANAPLTVGGSGSSEVQGNANGTITVTTTWSY